MENKKKPSNTEDVVVLSRAEYESMQAQMKWMAEQLLHAKRRTYGTSSEKADESLIEQLSLLFNEAETCADEAKAGEEKTTVASYSRKKKQSGSVRDILPKNIQEEVIEHRLSEEEHLCPQCGVLMEEIGSEVVETLKIIPAQAVLVKDVYYTYACRRCKRNCALRGRFEGTKEKAG